MPRGGSLERHQARARDWLSAAVGISRELEAKMQGHLGKLDSKVRAELKTRKTPRIRQWKHEGSHGVCPFAADGGQV